MGSGNRQERSSQALIKDKIQLGSLSPVRDLTFVKDTVNGFIKIAGSEKAIGEVINVGSGFGITVGDLVNKIFSIMGKQVEVLLDESRVRPEKSEVMQLIADNSKAKELAGWQPTVSFDDGLKLTIEWIKDHINNYKTDIYNV